MAGLMLAPKTLTFIHYNNFHFVSNYEHLYFLGIILKIILVSEAPGAKPGSGSSNPPNYHLLPIYYLIRLPNTNSSIN